jgi:hypothetical protein
MQLLPRAYRNDRGIQPAQARQRRLAESMPNREGFPANKISAIKTVIDPTTSEG